ncbi:sugar transferase [Emticicia fluvialis]|uniref:sugar transferase n=1 Tax=Emticicia fluvialis TaxID=2974474 RepID=UPI0021653DDB|nr:sugar transferase [Emticicia fluvialis]
MYRFFIKHFLDLLISALGIIVLSPVLIVVTIGLFIANQGNPFFLQPRPGKNGKVFSIIKFRSMNNKKDIHGNLLSDAERLTKMGAFIRKNSIDEIPQLINVLKGDMSLIGPRPLRTYYMPLYNDTQKRRHDVRPGITGWAQVNGRNDISWTAKFEMDVYYVDHLSLALDARIAYLTLKKVLLKEGVSKQGYATTVPFNGHN